MKKMFVVLALIFVANNCNGGSDTSYITDITDITDYYAYLYKQHEKIKRKDSFHCGCDCPKQEEVGIAENKKEPTFYRGQIVWDVVSGKGIIKKIGSNNVSAYPIYVDSNNGTLRAYTRDGKHFDTDLLPSLYPYKVKIVKE